MPHDELTKPTARERTHRVWANVPLILWNLLIVAAAPVLLLLKLRRHIIHKSDGEFDLGRWTCASPTPDLTKAQARSTRFHVVFVGASFGEMMLMERLADAIRSDREVRITFCLRDRAAIANTKKLKPNQALAIWPFDFIAPVAKWLGVNKPDLVIFTERFRFHNFACASALFGAKVAVINGRCRRRKSAFYRLASFYYKWFFGAFHGFYMQNEEFREATMEFAPGHADVRATGDVKFDLARNELPPAQAVSLNEWLEISSTTPFLAAGSSSSADEERVVLDAFRRVRERFDCRLLLAPRRIQRSDEVAGIAQEFGFKTTTRTIPIGDADIYLLDTLGELASAYQYCQAAYVGGALDDQGHNVSEPLEWGVPVSYGMRRGHFEIMQRLCESVQASERISNAVDLASHWIEMLSDEEKRTAMGARGKAMLDQQRGAFEKTLQALNDLIDSGSTGLDPNRILSAAGTKV